MGKGHFIAFISILGLIVVLLTVSNSNILISFSPGDSKVADTLLSGVPAFLVGLLSVFLVAFFILMIFDKKRI